LCSEKIDDMIVAGIDLYRGSVLSREGAYYSISIVSKDKIIYEAQELSLPKVLRLLHEYKPRYLVVDNLYELAPDRKGLHKIFSLLPSSTEILLATYDPVEGYKDLREVAYKYGLYDLKKKPDSLTTARILAQLGLRGVGFKIRVWEEKVKILISRNKSSRAGGSSEDRYKRSSRAYVLRITKKIKDALDRAGFTYEMTLRRSSGGIDRAVFIVNASRNDLLGIVRPMRGRYVRVSLKPVIRSIINIPQETIMISKPIIVGIDPGMNYGIAIMDFEGRILLTETVFGGDLSVIINKITRYGSPVIIATDKRPVPDSVKKIASIFGAKIFEPDHISTDIEKEELVRSSGYNVGSIHERDALYAVLLFYRRYLPKFSQIDKIVRELGLNIDSVKIKADVARGVDIASAIEKIFSEALYEEDHKINLGIRDFLREFISEENRLRKLEEEFNKVVQENKQLKEKINELLKKLHNLQMDIEIFKKETKSEVLREREISLLHERIRVYQDLLKNLEDQVIELKNTIYMYKDLFKRVAKGEYIFIPVINELVDVQDLLKKALYMSDENLYIMMSRSSVDDMIVKKLLSRYLNRKIIIISEKDCLRRCFGDELEHICCVDINMFTDEAIDLDEWIIVKKDFLERLIAWYRESVKSLPKRLIKSEEDLLRILEEYRLSKNK